jgi:hypothetical protein
MGEERRGVVGVRFVGGVEMLKVPGMQQVCVAVPRAL